MQHPTAHRPLCLLTGASSGIGRELAAALAVRGIDLILVARRRDRLEDLATALRAQHGIAVHVRPTDLSDPNNAEALYRAVSAEGLQPELLVNNAGMGLHGPFVDTDLEAELRMMRLNMGSLVVLTKLAVADMRAAGRGRIMNLASLVAFWPFPRFTVYAATKAFVLSFSEALRAELAGSGVSVTALCPGTADTEFTTPAMAATNAYSANPPMDPKVIAERGAKALLKGEGTVVVGLRNQVIAQTPRFTPRDLMVRITGHLSSPR